MFYVGPENNNFDSLKVWNNNFQIMPNGNGIYGYASATQGALIIPFPDDPLKYYLFTILPTVFGFGSNLHYSVIDMSLNGNTGDVTVKNNLISNLYFTEKMEAVKHGNGRDWWLLTHEGYSVNNRFIKFLITPFGIQGPYYQNIGTLINNGDILGQMKFSRNGNKLVLAGMGGSLNVFDFNRCTGMLSNTLNLSQVVAPMSGGFYGCTFSPNENILFVSKELDSLLQYDLTAANVMATKNLLLLTANNCENGQLLLAPDDKIYMATICGGSLPNNVFTNENMNLTVINNPDVYGPGCNIAPNSFNLGGRRSFLGLPNIQNYNLGQWAASPCDTLTSIYEMEDALQNIHVFPNPATNHFTIAYDFLNNRNGEFVLMNTFGKVVERQKLYGTFKSLFINTTKVPGGVYIYRIVLDDGGIKSGKLVLVQ
ncbi:MAG TPA: T9SS type A sorting domain-containing protein [Bacteroidia bacterium]|nr:T9SS type A sorting domain-containing protein [Bacteroidia bacterium]